MAPEGVSMSPVTNNSVQRKVIYNNVINSPRPFLSRTEREASRTPSRDHSPNADEPGLSTSSAAGPDASDCRPSAHNIVQTSTGQQSFE